MFNAKFLLITATAMIATHAATAEPVAPAAAAATVVAPAATATAVAPAATAATTAPAATKVAAATPAKPKIICVTTPETGSLVKSRKECGTAEEWKVRQQGARQQAIEMQTSRLETAQ